MNMERLEFGKGVFEHRCGGALERTETEAVACDRCAARFSLSEWDEAQRRKVAEAAARHRVMLGSLPALSGRLGTAAERN